MKARFLALILWHACLLTAATGEPSPQQPRLRTVFYRNHRYTDFVDAQAKALVFVFMNPTCPIVQQYIPRLKALYDQYRRRGVVLVGVYSSPGLNIRDISLHAHNRKIPFRVVHDREQRLVKFYDIERTAEALVLHPTEKDSRDRLKVLYRGPIDDQFHVGGRRPAPQVHFLKKALDEILGNKTVTDAEIPGEGCVIQREDPAPLTGIKFYEHVSPILQRRCETCHRPGGAGPMPLISYDEVQSYASMIAEQVHDRRMPPWPGNSPLAFNDDKRLTAREVETLVSWAKTGTEKGDETKAPKALVWPDSTAWQIGQPDVIYKTKPYRVPATGALDYVYYLVPTHLTEDKFIQAIEVRTKAPEVVHHIQVLAGKPDPSVTHVTGPVNLNPLQVIALHGFSLEDSKLIANYVPGNNDNALTYPPEKGLRLHRGAILYIENHYTTNGTAVTDETEVGIIYRRDPPQIEVHTQWFYRARGHFTIPPHEQHHEMVKDDIFIPRKDVRVTSLRMHLHARGKDFLIEKVSPASNGIDRIERILSIPSWDFNWQRNYYFAPDKITQQSPVYLLGGETLKATAHWDNSRLNPNNPNPNVNVYWGQETKDEMMAIMMTYEELTRAQAAELRRGR